MLTRNRLEPADHYVPSANQHGGDMGSNIDPRVAAAIADEGRAVNNYWPNVSGRTEYIDGQANTITANGETYWHNGLSIARP